MSRAEVVFQLVKFWSGRWIWGLAFLGSLIVFGSYRSYPQETGDWIPIWIAVITCGVVSCAFHTRRYTFFEASLPVLARDLLTAKVIFIVGWVWLYLLASAAVTVGCCGGFLIENIIPFFVGGAVITLAHVCFYSLRPADLSTPQWWKLALQACVLFALSPVWAILYVTIDWAAGAMVILTISLLIAGALFLKTWRSLSASLQLAPPDREFTFTELNDADPESIGQSSVLLRAKFLRSPYPYVGEATTVSGIVPSRWSVWKLVLRSLLNFITIMYLFLLLVDTSAGDSNLYIGAFWLFLAMTTSLGDKAKWLFTLPVSPRSLFAVAVAMPLVVFALGSFIHSLFSPQPTGRPILEAVTIAMVVSLMMMVIRLPHLYPRFLPLWRILILSVFGTVVWILWRPWGSALWRPSRIDKLFASIPPDRLPFCIGGVAAIGAVFYWLAYLGFRRTEFPPRRVTADR